MSAPFVVRTRGRSGHASIPSIADNALLSCAAHRSSASTGPSPGTRPRRRPSSCRARRGATGARSGDTRIGAARVRALLRGAARADVLADADPGLAAAERDPEHLRGHGRLADPSRPDAGGLEALVRGVLGDGDYELEWIEASGGTRSLDTPLWDVIAAWVQEADPEAGLAPICLSASPTATGCARRSARSPTASSRCDDARRGVGAARPLGERADSDRRSRARRRLLPLRRASLLS